MRRGQHLHRCVEKVAHHRVAAYRWRQTVASGTLIEPERMAEANDRDAQFWIGQFDEAISELVTEAVEAALAAAQHHTEKGRPFSTLDVRAIADDALRQWKEKTR